MIYSIQERRQHHQHHRHNHHHPKRTLHLRQCEHRTTTTPDYLAASKLLCYPQSCPSSYGHRIQLLLLLLHHSIDPNCRHSKLPCRVKLSRILSLRYHHHQEDTLKIFSFSFLSSVGRFVCRWAIGINASGVCVWAICKPGLVCLVRVH